MHIDILFPDSSISICTTDFGNQWGGPESMSAFIQNDTDFLFFQRRKPKKSFMIVPIH